MGFVGGLKLAKLVGPIQSSRVTDLFRDLLVGKCTKLRLSAVERGVLALPLQRRSLGQDLSEYFSCGGYK